MRLHTPFFLLGETKVVVQFLNLYFVRWYLPDCIKGSPFFRTLRFQTIWIQSFTFTWYSGYGLFRLFLSNIWRDRSFICLPGCLPLWTHNIILWPDMSKVRSLKISSWAANSWDDFTRITFRYIMVSIWLQIYGMRIDISVPEALPGGSAITQSRRNFSFSRFHADFFRFSRRNLLCTLYAVYAYALCYYCCYIV